MRGNPLFFRINGMTASTSSGNGKEVRTVGEYFVEFTLSVAAGIISYYICRWLDRTERKP